MKIVYEDGAVQINLSKEEVKRVVNQMSSELAEKLGPLLNSPEVAAIIASFKSKYTPS